MLASEYNAVPDDQQAGMHHRRLKVDVGGTVFTTLVHTINRIPNTRLWRLAQGREDDECILESGVYYVDRNPLIFHAILDCYRTGQFHIPCCSCISSVRQELEFWEIPTRMIASCCQRKLQSHEMEETALADLKKEFKCELSEYKAMMTRGKSFRRWLLTIWIFLEFPNSSRCAKGWAIVSGALTIATIILLACTSHPDLVQPYVYNSTIGGENIDQLIPGEKMKRALLAEPHPVIVIMDQTVNIILTLEFMVRFLTCPGKLRFFTKVLNWVDFITFSTYWSFISMFAAFEHSPKDAPYIVTMNVFSALVTIRIFRIFRLAGIFKGLRVLMLLVKKNFKELITLIMFFIIGMLMFSTMIFFAELHIDDDKFPSIVHGLWWSIITMTTVGYGDVVPSSSTGQMVGAVCALSGILLSGLAIPIISNNFNLYYNYSHAQDEKDEIDGKNNTNARGENGDVPLNAREKAGSRGIRYIYFYEA